MSLDINEKLALTESRVHAGKKGPDFEGLVFEVEMLDFYLLGDGGLLKQEHEMIILALEDQPVSRCVEVFRIEELIQSC